MNSTLKMLIVAAVMSVCSSTSYSELLFHRDTLSFNQGIDFSIPSVKTVLHDNSDGTGCGETIDFFYRSAERCCLAVGCHCGFRFGSSGTLYRSKVPFSGYDFSTALDLNPNGFIEAAASEWQWCTDYKGFHQPSDMGVPDYSDYESGFMILKTHQERYVLLRVRYIPVISGILPGSSPPQYETVEERIELNWFLQTDGTADFRGIQMEGIVRPRYHTVHRTTTLGTPEVFSLRGERITDQVHLMNLVIMKNSAGNATKSVIHPLKIR